MTISASTLRNIIAILRNIDRDQIEAVAGPITDNGWIAFRDNPHEGYLRMGGHLQDSIARIVSERMEPRKAERVVGADFRGEVPVFVSGAL
jgi:hypothetical protein